ncbi:DNA-3-methyladenine glycosylase family protein [Alkaliphilus peptidifermentans]|uniref:DNA-(apurinic or apyrimidinic site) lyase n=1 Tax=Alkaliphilus peptidifermentans DSM 18978 TaxID=1120976 RepID=A0A1G5IAM8_9FIRM|nr:DNA glycosylase [Alkaliphilus peptidifermentans]SCY73205.1 N-glycosylase/DNA lyase [Alkaliphilus peptidifermentans DSM 18978]
MKYEWLYQSNKIIVKNVKDFELKDIFECGQCFRWRKEDDNSYTGVAYNKLLNINKIDEDIHLLNTNPIDFEEIWINYFDLNTDYAIIKKNLIKKDDVMKRATSFGNGIRILKQEPWETIVSFIVSANNNIPRIMKAIELLCSKYGEEIGSFNGKLYYSFPRPEIIAKLKPEDLSACNMGYRGPYIIKTANQVLSNPNLIPMLRAQNTDHCRKGLIDFSGVGPKVANCIAFFAFGKLDAFPVDVWVKRLMEYFYFHSEMKPKEIEDFAKNQYGSYAGYAQQYLFYYGRELGIGKGD